MYEKLPKELKENVMFCLWKYEERDGNMTKVLYQINGKHGDSTNKRTFSDFRLVVNAIICQNNFRHSFSLTWSGKTCDIRRSL